MDQPGFLHGFSKLHSAEKAQCIASLTSNPEEFLHDLKIHRCTEADKQNIYKDLSENQLGNYHLPFSIAPNFLINGKLYHLPMVSEESSVVAAAASAAKYWSLHGGFQCKVIGTVKTGQVHFLWKGTPEGLKTFFNTVRNDLLAGVQTITASMEKRGGGITDISLNYHPEILDNYYQLDVAFQTVDSMGANFINTVLEAIACHWSQQVEANQEWPDSWQQCEVLMSILSNYTPGSCVECSVSAPFSKLNGLVPDMDGATFAKRFKQAVDIACSDVYRATTHNKGIMNGVDALVIATGNDFRAVAANVHTYASRQGSYSSLSKVTIQDERFGLSLELPLAVGTVGGATAVHPMARHAMDILGKPGAEELMMLMAAAGLANNFSAVKALISSGIQAGHMRLHLSNIATQVGATSSEKLRIQEHFVAKTVSYVAVKDYLELLRNENPEG